MNRFTIKDIENLTGIKSHTLRIWEQRYGIPKPKRTPTNIRYYDDEDLKLLLNVSILNRQGHKISRITGLTKEELEKLVHSITVESECTSMHIDCLMSAMFKLDESAFERVLSTHLIKHGLEKTMVELFFPFMKRIGVLWQTGQVNPPFEHFISNLIRQKVIVAIDSLSSNKNKHSKNFILFLPEDEMHELGLLFANYIIRSRGHHTIYFGQNLPYDHLDHVINLHPADYIMTVVTSSASTIPVQNFIAKLSKKYNNHNILLTGKQICECDSLNVPQNCKVLKRLEDLSAFMNTI
jgi:MerR family transcriptional regulator, light-induced transcriptional regulator